MSSGDRPVEAEEEEEEDGIGVVVGAAKGTTGATGKVLAALEEDDCNCFGNGAGGGGGAYVYDGIDGAV